ncbi:MAG: signal peptidase I, partial [Edwardsiella piscicida]
MANMFALILVIATLVTGIVWCIDRFKLAPARRARLAQINSQTEQGLDTQSARQAVKAPGWI